MKVGQIYTTIATAWTTLVEHSYEAATDIGTVNLPTWVPDGMQDWLGNFRENEPQFRYGSTAVLFGLTALSTAHEFDTFAREAVRAVAYERDKDPAEEAQKNSAFVVGDMLSSRNSVVKKQLGHLRNVTLLRAATDVPMAFNVRFGLMAKLPMLFIEGTQFQNEDMDEILKIKKEQRDQVGKFFRGDVVRAIVRLYQHTLAEDSERREGSELELREKMPLFERMADRFVDPDPRFDVGELLYLVGMDKVEQTKEFDAILEHGLNKAFRMKQRGELTEAVSSREQVDPFLSVPQPAFLSGILERSSSAGSAVERELNRHASYAGTLER